VAVLTAHLPADSATARAVHGEAARWSLTDHLLAVVADRLAIMSWQLGGNRHAPRPEPLPRPGADAPPTRRYGRTSRRPADVAAYLRRYAPPKEVTADG
jgi:hypothetical protein